MKAWADAMTKSAAWVVKNLTTLWLRAPGPDLSSTGPLAWLQDKLSWVVAAVMVASVLVACYRVASSGRGSDLRSLGEAIWRTVFISTTGVTMMILGIEIGDIFSDWILKASDLDLSQTLVFAAGTAPGLVLIMALIVLLTQVIQFVLMMVRNAMLVILAGTLPITAAGSNTDMGRQAWLKAVAWSVAFVLYKPVATLIYAFSFRMASADQQITTQLTGVTMMILAIAALPALMKFVVPATAAMSGGNAGAMAAGAVGATLAVGAVVVTGGAAGLAGGAAAAPAASGAGGAASGASGAGASGASGAGASGAVGAPAAAAGSGPASGSSPPSAGSSGSSSGTSGVSLGDVSDAAGAARQASDSGKDTASGAIGDES
ncbi:hypothetical protein [Pengzhenrongella sp.]|uniref:hypothetical protein n=1 Tax=Pengzhenrongella sp. TaxID=2888820 RepID=UPI002F93D59D